MENSTRLFSEGTVGEWKAFALSELIGSPDNMLGGIMCLKNWPVAGQEHA